MTNFDDVKIFMKAFGQKVITKPQFPDEKTMNLRFDLIKEELDELEQATKDKDLTEEDALVNARLARILTVDDYDFTKNRPILWSPSADYQINAGTGSEAESP